MRRPGGDVLATCENTLDGSDARRCPRTSGKWMAERSRQTGYQPMDQGRDNVPANAALDGCRSEDKKAMTPLPDHLRLAVHGRPPPRPPRSASTQPIERARATTTAVGPALEDDASMDARARSSAAYENPSARRASRNDGGTRRRASGTASTHRCRLGQWQCSLFVAFADDPQDQLLEVEC